MAAGDPAPERIALWRNEPEVMVDDLFSTPGNRIELDEWQKAALRAFASLEPIDQRISLQACAGPGKTTALAMMGWNFMTCYAEVGEHPKGLATSIDGSNLKSNLWAELAKWRDRSPYLQRAFEWTSKKIFARSDPANWFIEARTYAKKANADEMGRTLSGHHAKYVLYLIDESGDINPAILRSAEQGLGRCAWGKIVQAGNPTSQQGMLYIAASSQSDMWRRIRINGDPDDANRSPRIDINWARKQIALYGRDNPWVMAYILGQFPPTAINTLLTVEEVEAAMARELKPEDYNWAQKRLGVDVARFGDDRSVVCQRQGLWCHIDERNIMNGERTTNIAGRVGFVHANWGGELIFVDDTGHWGHGVIDNLVAAQLNPIGIQFHGPANDPRYKNKRTEMWLEMAKWVKRGGALPRISSLIPELTMPTYWFEQGKFVLEDKDQIKARLKRSPDLADAIGLTFAWPDMPGLQGDPNDPLEGLVERLRQQGVQTQSTNSDYDPIKRAEQEEGRRRRWAA